MKRFNLKAFFLFLFLVFALVGFLDSLYLTFKHFNSQAALSCTIFEGCNLVLSSNYAKVGKVPLASIGAVYYFALLSLGYTFLTQKKKKLLTLAFLVSSLGLLVSAYLTYLQAFVIKAFCSFCLLSALSTLLIFISLGLLNFKFRF